MTISSVILELKVLSWPQYIAMRKKNVANIYLNVYLNNSLFKILCYIYYNHLFHSYACVLVWIQTQL